MSHDLDDILNDIESDDFIAVVTFASGVRLFEKLVRRQAVFNDLLVALETKGAKQAVMMKVMALIRGARRQPLTASGDAVVGACILAMVDTKAHLVEGLENWPLIAWKTTKTPGAIWSKRLASRVPRTEARAPKSRDIEKSFVSRRASSGKGRVRVANL